MSKKLPWIMVIHCEHLQQIWHRNYRHSFQKHGIFGGVTSVDTGGAPCVDGSKWCHQSMLWSKHHHDKMRILTMKCISRGRQFYMWTGGSWLKIHTEDCPLILPWGSYNSQASSWYCFQTLLGVSSYNDIHELMSYNLIYGLHLISLWLFWVAV